MPDNPSKRLLRVLLPLGLVALLAGLWFQRFAIYDWWRLRGYQPPVAIARLATETTMNSDARRLFYVYRPELEGKVEFNADCIDSEQTIVLGCYVARQGIYLFDVTDERLQGVEEVTAAHELLHAAYERLSSSERRRIDGLTAQAFSQLDDERVKGTIESYRKKDPNIVANELHSILATEVKELPSELEIYYQRYFADRQKIVAFSQTYESEFTSRQAQAAQYMQQLNALKKQIENLNRDLKAQAASLNSQYEALVRDRDSAEPAAYNQRVDRYNGEVNQYNNQVSYVGTLIDQYNLILKQYNALALEQNELLKAIDSRPDSIPTQ